MKKILLIIIALIISTTQTYAADCFTDLGTSQTIDPGTTCSLSSYVDGNDPARLVSGVDSGAGDTNTAILTIQSGSMTINSNETLVTGSVSLTGGSIAMAVGGEIAIGSSMWMIDADADGYPTDAKVYIQSTAPTDGVRLNTISDIATADCDDASFSGTNSCCAVGTYYVDSDGDGYGTGSGISMCPASGYVANDTDCDDSNISIYNNNWVCDTCYDTCYNTCYQTCCSTCCQSVKVNDDCGCNNNTYSCVGYCWDGATCGASGTCTWCDNNYSCNCSSCNPYSCNPYSCNPHDCNCGWVCGT